MQCMILEGMSGELTRARRGSGMFCNGIQDKHGGRLPALDYNLIKLIVGARNVICVSRDQDSHQH